MIITIDGPTASGKSTIARALAKRLGYFYVYSGLLYRALAYLLVNHFRYKKDDLCNPRGEDVVELIDPQRFYYQYDDQFKERIIFDGQDITPHLQERFIDQAASIVSINKYVRDWVTNLQRQIARDFSVVVDGRDAGTVVFPGADIKFYFTAKDEIRAERWRAEQQKLGNDFTQDEALQIIIERDKRDSERKLAPLTIPNDAIVVDNSDLSIEQSVEKMMELIDNNLP